MHSFKCCYSVTKLCLTFRDPWTVACQAPLSSTVSWSLLQFIDLNVNLLKKKKKAFTQHVTRHLGAVAGRGDATFFPAFRPGPRFPLWSHTTPSVAEVLGFEVVCFVFEFSQPGSALAFVAAPGASGVPLLPRVASPLIGICFVHGPRGVGVSAGSRFPGASSVAMSVRAASQW